MIKVKKFGGTSVSDTTKILNIAKKCEKDYKEGHKIVVVLSAMGKYTDELIAISREISGNVPKREMDMLLTCGEQISVSLMAMAFDKLGIPAVSLNAFQVKILTNDTYGDAEIIKIETERIEKELAKNKIVIIAGFQGIDKARKLYDPWKRRLRHNSSSLGCYSKSRHLRNLHRRRRRVHSRP